MDAIQALKTRRSVRAFQSRPVARELLIDLVDCARLAPTAMNQQVWEFVIVTNPQALRQIASLITHATWLPTATAAIAVLAKPANYFVEDAAAATVNILTAAQAHGLGSCWVSGNGQPYADAVRQLLGAPDDYKFFSLIALGYPAEEPTQDKRPLVSLLHWDGFGKKQ